MRYVGLSCGIIGALLMFAGIALRLWELVAFSAAVTGLGVVANLLTTDDDGLNQRHV